MPEEKLPAELGEIVAVAQAAGEVALEWFGRTHATRKADGTLATEADLAAEELILERLAALHPEDAVCSEESYSHCRVGRGRLWSVDPVDGTHNFAAGLGLWAVSIGLVEGGRPVLGVVHSPPLGLTYAAQAGQGAWRNGVRLSAPSAAPPQRNDLIGYTSELPGPVLRAPHKGRNLGSAALHGCLVVSGAFRAALFTNWVLWDLAAVLCLAGELQVEARWECGDLLEDLSTLESAQRQKYLLLAPHGLCDLLLVPAPLPG
jgi:myo-inositol-1(or 4)-monophosphatase